MEMANESMNVASEGRVQRPIRGIDMSIFESVDEDGWKKKMMRVTVSRTTNSWGREKPRREEMRRERRHLKSRKMSAETTVATIRRVSADLQASERHGIETQKPLRRR